MGQVELDPDELKRYSTQQFPPTTCVIYASVFFHDELQEFVEQPGSHRGFIDLLRFLADHERWQQSPRYPSTSTYLAHQLREYPYLADGIGHPTAVGQEALALLYQQALLGATPSRNATLFDAAVTYPSSTPVDFADYVTTHCP